MMSKALGSLSDADLDHIHNLAKRGGVSAASATIWGSMAKFRDRLLQLADHRDASSVAALREVLERLGPAGLWLETARCYLRDHGFVQSGNESLAQTMARALGISTHELRICIAENRVGAALLARFRDPEIATDNTP
jgi:hypothetical protein